MTDSPGRMPAVHRVSLLVRSGWLAHFVMGVTGLAQWLVARKSGLPLGVALALPLFVAAQIAVAYTLVTIRVRTSRLVAQLRRVETGDLKSAMPQALDPELNPVRDAFAAMQGSLDALTSRLKNADEARRRLFADLAHELATPTSSVLGIAEALSGPALTAQNRARMVAALDHEATRLERLVRDVRDLAHIEDPDVTLAPVVTDVAALVRRVCARGDIVVGRGVRIETHAETTAMARVDPGRIEQLLINLLTNAQRYTPADRCIDVSVTAEADSVQLVVEDEGSGVPEAMLSRLGERMLRLDPSRSRGTGGHGLGLSIVSATVERHGGTLAFRRADSGGLRVEVGLPMASG